VNVRARRIAEDAAQQMQVFVTHAGLADLHYGIHDSSEDGGERFLRALRAGGSQPADGIRPATPARFKHQGLHAMALDERSTFWLPRLRCAKMLRWFSIELAWRFQRRSVPGAC
jgi:hypothetical protein